MLYGRQIPCTFVGGDACWYRRLCLFVFVSPSNDMPQYTLKLKDQDGQRYVFDHSRKRWLLLTPEERVRQFFIRYLVENRGYPLGLIATEMPLHINGLSRRADIVVFRHTTPLLIVECKAPTVLLTQNVAEQAAAYNHALGVDYIVITNGSTTFCYGRVSAQASWLALNEVPAYKSVE